MALRTLEVGTLHVTGPLFRLELASTREVKALAGDDVEVVLRYRYTEADAGKEDCALVLRVAFDGKPVGEREVRLADTPLVVDRASGRLSQIVKVPGSGVRRGFFAVEGTYTNASWTESRRTTGRDFRQEGDFVVIAE